MLEMRKKRIIIEVLIKCTKNGEIFVKYLKIDYFCNIK